MSRHSFYSAPLQNYFQGFQGGINYTTPNGTIPVAWIKTNTQQTSGDIALITHGANGALLRNIPNNSTTGGNKRGTGAVDLQRSRSAAAAVASGVNSALVGGDDNTVSGSHSVGGGQANAIAGAYSWGFGQSCTVNATASFGSAVGAQCDTYAEVGTHAQASGITSGASDAQQRWRVQRRATANATATVITSDGGAAATTNTVVIPNFSSAIVHALIVARTGAGTTHAWELKCAYTKQGAGTAAMVGGAAVAGTTVAGATAWLTSGNVSAAANNFEITVTGAAATNIQWVAWVHTVETRF